MKVMNMTVAQKVRTRIAIKSYYYWQQNRLVSLPDLIRQTADDEYREILTHARLGDADCQEEVETLNIRNGIPRSPTELANDLYVLNYLCDTLEVDTRSLDKAKVKAAADKLLKIGADTRNDRAIGKGIDTYMRLYKDFNEKEDPSEQMPSTDINITGDVTVIDSSRANISDDERKRLERRYGVTEREVQELREQEDGTYAVEDDDDDDESNDELSENYNKTEN